MAELNALITTGQINFVRIASDGGLIQPALNMAELIRENEVWVHAEDRCISA